MKDYEAHLQRLGREYGEALEKNGLAVLVIHSGAPLLQSPFDDFEWPFKACPGFAHWLPLVEPNAYLVLRPGETVELHRTQAPSFWEGPAPLDSEHFWDHFDVKQGSDTEIRALARAPRVAFIGNNRQVGRDLGFADDAINPAELISAIHAIRALKSNYERTCIGLANRKAARGHQRIADMFRDGEHSELALHLEYLAATEQDSWQAPYGGIVALGEHAAILHHCHLDTATSSSPTLLVDAGATYCGYASDITRTWHKGQGPASDTFRTLLAGIDQFQQKLCDELKPGLWYEEVHDKAHGYLAEVLLEAELATGSAAELVDTGVTRAFFPHGLGHSLGVQVHDVGCKERPPAEKNSYLRTTAQIADGHVFTVEPGCYFISSLLEPLRAGSAPIQWANVDAIHDFGGIRIEDDIAVKSGGNENLTRDNWPDSP